MSRSARTRRLRRTRPPRTIPKTLNAAVLVGIMTLTGSQSVQAARPVWQTEAGLPAATANGSPASPTGVFSPVTPQNVRRAYAHSALRLHSRLTTIDERPIASAKVDVLERAAGSQDKRPIGQAITAPDGTVTVVVPSGPSRTIYLAYRPFAGTPYTAETEVFETVAAGLRLSATPRHTTPTGSVLFRGRVLGTIPPHGVIVELLVYYQGTWQPIRTPRTSPTGTFTLRYQFHDAAGTFPFALRVRDGQIGFPYQEGRSQPVDVATS
jgi:hypothetical protein